MTSLISSGVDPAGNNNTVGGFVGAAVDVVEVVVENTLVVKGVVDGSTVAGAELFFIGRGNPSHNKTQRKN